MIQGDPLATDVVIVRLAGGLGNQLFQYSAGRAVSQRLAIPLKLDLSAVRLGHKRRYRLDHFNIEAKPTTRDELSSLVSSSGGLGRLYRWAQRFLPTRRRRIFVEGPTGYDPRILKVGRRVYLVGYWQREEYFSPIENLLRRELTVRSEPDARNRDMLALIDRTQSVSVHVRRGDYVSDPVAHTYHGLCPLSYYDAAIKAMAERVPQLHLFVFSDDMEWTRRNLRYTCATTFVRHNGVEKDYEDLRLMARCKHHIIANSSFSWWGAWLSPYTSKIVIAPKRWFRDTGAGRRDPVPARWLRL